MSPETYWKRRVAVLAAALMLVALIAWACQAASSGNGGEQQQAGVDPDAGATEEDDPENGDSAEQDEDSDDDDEEEDEDEDEGSGDGDGGSGGSAGGGGDARPNIPEPRQASDPCRPQDVMVTMEVDESDYASGEEPRISLTLVNLEEQTCTVDVGPANMEIRIISGSDRVYSTADCVENGSRNEELEQGRPLTVHHDWDRKRSWEDCRDEDRNAGSGTYQAELHSHYDNGAETESFRLN